MVVSAPVSAVLGIETSGTWCSAALVRGAETFARRERVGHAHSRHLIGMIEAVLADAGLPLDACDAIAFGAGPGSFTGLRIACAVAQGLAYGVDCPVVPIGTLDAIALSIIDEIDIAAGCVLVAQDARMGELYWSVFEVIDRGPVSRLAVALTSADLLPAELVERELLPLVVGGGNAWAVHGGSLAGTVGRVVFRETADAVAVARLGAAALERGEVLSADRAAPVYVRDRVASTMAERRALRIAADARLAAVAR